MCGCKAASASRVVAGGNDARRIPGHGRVIRLAQIIIPSLLKLIRSNELAAPASASSSDAAIVA
jgi:hypothetical protein